MLLFLKSVIIGIGKIIPGVSGSLLAINFGIYEKLINSLTNFWADYKNNFKFLFTIFSGIFLSIILCSNLVAFLLNNYRFITMMFFIGLIIGGTYKFASVVKFSKNNLFLILLIIISLLFISFGHYSGVYLLKNNFFDNIIFFMAGVIEVFSSIIPGISGTAILMMLGIYNNVLHLITNLFNAKYILNNINLYISFSLGIMLSFIINVYLVAYLLKKHRQITNVCIFAFAIFSIIYLTILTLNSLVSVFSLIIGLIFLIFGLLIAIIIN